MCVTQPSTLLWPGPTSQTKHVSTQTHCMIYQYRETRHGCMRAVLYNYSSDEDFFEWFCESVPMLQQPLCQYQQMLLLCWQSKKSTSVFLDHLLIWGEKGKASQQTKVSSHWQNWLFCFCSPGAGTVFLLNFSLMPPPSTPWLLPLPFSATTATFYLQLTLVCFCKSACVCPAVTQVIWQASINITPVVAL